MSVTASTVRARLATDAKRTAGLSEDALHTLRAGARGRLHPEVIAAYNKGRKPAQRYVLGASRAEAVAKREAAKAAREAAVKAGLTVGTRGPLPKAAKEVLSQSKG